MPRRIVPNKTVEQVKRLLATKKFVRDIAKEAGVSLHYIWQLNERYRIRPIVRKRIKISERKRRFIEKALGLAKYTSMIKIAKRAGVSMPTVQHINLLQRIRDKKALRRGRVRILGKKFEGIVEELIKHPEKSFQEIAKQYKVSQPTVGDINKRLGIQPKEHIRERKLIKLKTLKKKRYYLFSPEEKWKIIQESRYYIVGVISKFAVPENIQIPIDELTQETMLRAFSALDLVTTKKYPKRYIGGIAARVTIQYLQQEGKRLGIKWEEFEAMITKKKIRGK